MKASLPADTAASTSSSLETWTSGFFSSVAGFTRFREEGVPQRLLLMTLRYGPKTSILDTLIIFANSQQIICYVVNGRDVAFKNLNDRVGVLCFGNNDAKTLVKQSYLPSGVGLAIEWARTPTAVDRVLGTGYWAPGTGDLKPFGNSQPCNTKDLCDESCIMS